VKFKRKPTAVDRKTTLRLVGELADRVDTALVPQFTETEGALISLSPSQARGPGEDSLLYLHKAFPRQSAEPFIFARAGWIGGGSKRGTGTHVAVWLSDADEQARSSKRDLEQPISNLAAKLEKKLAQIRTGDNRCRVLVCSSWLTGELPRAPEHLQAALQRRVITRHAGVAGLLMVMRKPTGPLSRHRYTIRPYLPESANALPAGLLSSLQSMEQNQPIPSIEGAT